jgi:hypothetical protein
MAKDATARRRKPAPKDDASSSSEDEMAQYKASKKTTTARDEFDDVPNTAGSIALDILRVLTFLVLASMGLSYLVTNGESFFWGNGNQAKYLRPAFWAQKLVRY